MAKLKDIFFTIFLALIIVFLGNYMRLCVVLGTLNPYHIRIPKISFSFFSKDNNKEDDDRQEEVTTQNTMENSVNLGSNTNTQSEYIIEIDNSIFTNSNTSTNTNTTESNNITIEVGNNTKSEIVILVGE